AIGQALSAVAHIPGVSDLDPRAAWFSTVQTLGEEYYRRYGHALATAHVENQALHELAKQLQRPARDAVLLALARRGDKSVHGEIVKLAQGGEGMFRAWAATALEKIGTKDDLPMLRTLAKTDPLVRKGPLRPPNPPDTVGPG